MNTTFYLSRLWRVALVARLGVCWFIYSWGIKSNFVKVEVLKMYKRKQLLINDKDFYDLKRIWRGGLFRICSDSAFIRSLIEHELKREVEK